MQRQPLDEGHGEPRRRVPDVRVLDGDDVGAVDLAGGVDLVTEALAVLGVACQMRQEHFDREELVPGVVAQVHSAHAAVSQAGKQRVGAEPARIFGRQRFHDTTFRVGVRCAAHRCELALYNDIKTYFYQYVVVS